MLLAAIRDETRELSNEYMQANLELLTANRGPFQLPEERHEVWPTSGMQTDLEAVLLRGSAAALEERYKSRHQFKYGKWRPPRPGIVEAYLYFAEQVRRYLDDDPEELPFELLDLSPEDRAEILVEALVKDIQLVTIALEQEDDAQVIFETLNDRGEPLTPSDLVRNFVFLTATREAMDVHALYPELWSDFEEQPEGNPFWKQVERQEWACPDLTDIHDRARRPGRMSRWDRRSGYGGRSQPSTRPRWWHSAEVAARASGRSVVTSI